MDNSKYNCPNCGSTNTASIPLVYKRGHATGNATHKEVVGYNVQTTTKTYEDGHKETTETGRTPVYGDVTRPTYTETDLAQEVAPPTPPAEPMLHLVKNDTWSTGCGLIGCFLPIALLITYIILSYVVKISIRPSIWDNFTYLFIAGIVLYLLNNRRKTSKRNDELKQEHALATERYKQRVKKYHQDLEEWQHLYICNRCGHRFRVDE